ncbi:hypothetical protein LA366_02520 [Aeromonas jandaei]|uniref:Uncharacterized protein n=1 Tax=Aeromonas jandaei TaxID=650 RepID=A0A7T4A8M6_AERJA|nr:hypothetical protein [Aeromonas jandaei]QQB19308.1 hypothetical protein I6H43_17575 [Aeromonas jandaei]UCA33982.1 hypothetical protein LA366_02520 [Aeromonas jandaei]
MGRVSLPDHEKLDTCSPLRVRGTVGHRQVWQEVGAEVGMTETAFARTSLLMLLNSISKHEPQILARAVKRANRSLIEQGYPPVTVDEILKGDGLPERGLLTFTAADEAAYDEERPKKPVQKLIGLINFVLGR